MEQSSVQVKNPLTIAVLWGPFFIGLYYTTFYNYLLFHFLAETFSIVIAFSIFIIAWNSRRFITNNYIIFIAIAYLSVAFLDLLHTISYKGMAIFTDYDYYANQLWIATRYLESLSLMAAYIFLSKKKPVNVTALFGSYMLITTGIFFSIFVWKIFPVCFIEGQGLTPFKKISEYIICLILIADIFLLYRFKSHFEQDVFNFLLLSLVFTIIAELAFTFYISNYGLSNMVGHYFKIFSFLMIYKAIIETGLTKPYDLLFRELKQSEQKMTSSRNMLQAVLNTIPVRVFWKDLDQNYLGCNQRFAHDVGLKSVEEVIGRSDFHLNSNEQSEKNRRDDLMIIKSGKEKLNYEEPQTGIDGKKRWVRTSKIPLTNWKGNIYGVLGCYEDVTDIREAQEQLRLSKIEAEKANEAKSVFLSSMSHELRTPLNSILGFSQLLDTDENDPLSSHQKSNLHIIMRSGEHLLQLINDVLDLSKIESGDLEMIIERVNICMIVSEVVEQVNPLAKTKNIQILTDEPDEHLYIEIDRTRFRQVIFNILSNAIKYNKPEGSVHLSCEPKDTKVRLIIADTGPGIDKNKHNRLFEPFDRLGAETSKIEGTGIGLTITKRLVEGMGGSISLESDIGQGTKFFIDFPVAEAVKEESSPGEKTDTGTESIQGNHTLLYIEDNLFNRLLLEEILIRTPKLTLLTAEDAVTGIDKAVEHKPDLILMDLTLPEISGFETFEKLKKLPETKDIPIVALSGNAMPLDIKKAKDAGFSEYLTKPVNIKELYRVVSIMLGQTDE